MTTSPIEAGSTTECEVVAFEVMTSHVLIVTDPAKLQRALNAILSLDLGVKAERAIRAEVREAIS